MLGLFFGLALVCAVFFGFGYSMGHKSATAAAAAIADAPTGSDPAESSNADTSAANKPSAGSPAVQAIPGYLSGRAADASTKGSAAPATKPVLSANATSVPIPMDGSAPARPTKPAIDPDGQIVETKPAVTRSTLPATTAATTTGAVGPVQALSAGNPVAASGGSTYVQIAAVSHKEDADVLLGALKRRGYTVFTRSSDSDKLIHVQVGPFANKKDADAMRLKLLGDGYNAILK